MSDTYVTLHGWVGSDVTFRSPQGVSVVNLRVASTARLKREGRWTDGETTWYSVTAWRQLADHVRDSVRKGDAVIVHGRLRTETWHREGQSSSSLQIEATLIGHDLSRGTSVFLRAPRSERAEPDGEHGPGQDPGQDPGHDAGHDAGHGPGRDTRDAGQAAALAGR